MSVVLQQKHFAHPTELPMYVFQTIRFTVFGIDFFREPPPADRLGGSGSNRNCTNRGVVDEAVATTVVAAAANAESIGAVGAVGTTDATDAAEAAEAAVVLRYNSSESFGILGATAADDDDVDDESSSQADDAHWPIRITLGPRYEYLYRRYSPMASTSSVYGLCCSLVITRSPLKPTDTHPHAILPRQSASKDPSYGQFQES